MMLYMDNNFFLFWRFAVVEDVGGSLRWDVKVRGRSSHSPIALSIAYYQRAVTPRIILEVAY